MRKIIKTVLLTAVTSLTLAMTALAAPGPLDGVMIDGSLLSSDERSESEEIFEWNLPDEKEGITPFGVYYASGTSSIGKSGSSTVYIAGTTDCYKTCDTVKVKLILQRLSGGTWTYVAERTYIAYDTDFCAGSTYMAVKSGYYYRVKATHTAIEGSKTESGSSTTGGTYIG